MEIDEISQCSIVSNKGTHYEIDDTMLYLDKNSPAYNMFPGKECVIFLVDCAPSMHFLLDREKSTPITTILRVTENFLRIKIANNESDPFAIVLFNTNIKKNTMELDGVNNITEISLPDSPSIKKLKEIHNKCNPDINKDNYLKELNTIFPSNENVNKNYLSNGLLVSYSLLKNYDKEKYKRKIFLFTDDDNPFKNDLDEKNACLDKTKELIDDDIIIEIFPMNFRDKFNLAIFYASIVPTFSDDDINTCGENKRSIEEYNDLYKKLSKRIRRKEMKKRYFTKCPFHITEKTKIYMNIYSNIKEANTGKLQYIDIKSKKLLKSSPYYKCKESGKELNPNQIGNYVMYGGKKIIFSKDDMKKVKMKEEPGLTLLGFKSIDKIYPYYNINESYFLYPNESYSNGSGKLINALIKQMANKRKCAIVRYIAMEGTIVKLCALFPQIERYNDEFFQNPPGFNMIILPWADEIRLNYDILSKFPDKLPYISNKQSDLAKKIIKKMNIYFDCRKFENYNIQKFFSSLLSISTDNSCSDKIRDTLVPNEERLAKVLDDIDEDYKHLIFGGKVRSNEEKKKKEEEINKEEERSPVKRAKYKRRKPSRIRKNLYGDEEDMKRKQYEIEVEHKREREPSSSSSEPKRDFKRYKKYKKKKREKKEKSSSDSSSKSESDSDDSSISVSKLTNTKLTKMFKTRELEDMTVNQLKRICYLRGISTRTLKKHEILSKLRSKLYIMTH